MIFRYLTPKRCKAGKVLASNPRLNHAAALFGADGQNYLFKDSTEGLIIKKFVKQIVIYSQKVSINKFLEKILEVPVANSDHVRTGWWIEFRNVKSE